MRFAFRVSSRLRRLLWVSLLLALPGVPAHASGVSKYHALQQQADAIYDRGDYEQAMKQYLALAKKGDTFSQYRVSFMYLEGQGLESDLIESFAWASLSAQNYAPELVRYRDAVSSRVPEKQHRKALRRVDYYMRKWGNSAIAEDAARGARQEMRDCTGSRLGARCTEVYAMEMPKFWGINPGSGSNPGPLGDGGGDSGSGSSSSSQTDGGGGATRDVAYYNALRQKIRELDAFIEKENTGTVTITDVATPDSQPKTETENDGR